MAPAASAATRGPGGPPRWVATHGNHLCHHLCHHCRHTPAAVGPGWQARQQLLRMGLPPWQEAPSKTAMGRASRQAAAASVACPSGAAATALVAPKCITAVLGMAAWVVLQDGCRSMQATAGTAV